MKCGLLEEGPPISGEFDILVADPPWRSDFGPTDSRSVERHYPTMLLTTIRALEVPAAADALLFLWATAPMLPAALLTMRSWQFSYRTSMVWCKRSEKGKEQMGVGQWVRGQHELILLGRRGSFSVPPKGTQPRSVIHAPRRSHSEKPEDLQDHIDRMWPQARKLEMFARRQRPGWTAWGNEVAPAAREATP